MNRPDSQQSSTSVSTASTDTPTVPLPQRPNPPENPVNLPVNPPTNLSGSSTPNSSSQTDRRNVAEILASLSGLMPEPPQNLEQPAKTNSGVTITPISTSVTTAATTELKSRAT